MTSLPKAINQLPAILENKFTDAVKRTFQRLDQRRIGTLVSLAKDKAGELAQYIQDRAMSSDAYRHALHQALDPEDFNKNGGAKEAPVDDCKAPDPSVTSRKKRAAKAAKVESPQATTTRGFDDAKFRQLIAEQLGINVNQVVDDASLVDDLKADSLDVVEVVMEVEDEFGITIPDDDYDKLRTVGKLKAYTEQKLA